MCCSKTEADLTSLYEIIKELRGEKGCPWDREQTPQSLKKYLIEECYEVLEAIDREDAEEVKEELGDILFLVLFMIFLYEERGAFTLKELIDFTCNKMISRHPHVFGEKRALTAEEVVRQWQSLKAKEGKEDSVLGNIPKSIPSLQRAYRIGERAGRVGFDWGRAEEVIEKIYEEIREIEEALQGSSSKALKEEIGDLLFSIANLSRKLNINPEEALRVSVDKFEKRFKKMEKKIKERGKKFEDLTLKELDEIWESLKDEECA